jgi:NAD(P)-dependent dehydrogenase (short-subunit alcohol dehydrogenase family)
MRLESLADGYRAVIFGASGGIGAAFVQQLRADARCARIYAGARKSASVAGDGVTAFGFDLMAEDSIAAAAQAIAADGPIDLVIVATGMLHSPSQQPEKTIRAVSAAALMTSYAINAVGPLLIAKHMLPLLAKERKAVFGALSARVSSISDNRSGGWHAYRASKAALNMLIRNAAIEARARNREAVLVGLHPGTVDTGMSRPFQAGVPADKLFTPAFAAQSLLGVIDGLTPADSGGLFAWDGQAIAF